MTENTFVGFDVPRENWSKLPHAFIENMHLMTGSEIKVILYILRHTWGFQDNRKKITLDEFENGRKRRDRSRLDSGTGLSRGAVKDGLKRAIEHGFIEVEEDDSDLGRVKRYYSLKMLSVKNLPPEGQKVTPRESETGPPSEKDTRGKIPQDTMVDLPLPTEVVSTPVSEESPLTEPVPEPSPVKERPKRKQNRRAKSGRVTEHQRYFSALSAALRIPREMTGNQRGRLNSFTKRIRSNGFDLAHIKAAEREWWLGWPGNTGSPPNDGQFLQRLEIVRRRKEDHDRQWT